MATDYVGRLSMTAAHGAELTVLTQIRRGECPSTGGRESRYEGMKRRRRARCSSGREATGRSEKMVLVEDRCS